MASSDIKMQGLAELQYWLSTLPEKLRANVMRGGLRAGGKVFVGHIRATSAFVDRSGHLRDSARVTTTLRGGARASVLVGPTRTKRLAFYAPMIEGGTKPHEIKAKPGGLLAIGVSKVQHPGIAPHPFMVPAFDAGHRGAVRAVADYVRKRLATKHGINVRAPTEQGDE